ncbi:redox-sensitive transcriptional activator SoxR [Noviherbaspirillum sp. CPCC 100848]|uniref:Redox-sensitive transcriptional activator SoxR n=1 Tax=Noviherbaspirillum album TaxID=3080276 RepID=A0ABU6JE27_9BURK|nr:redox-sensitive transcriptional activator SoxR [Noviherbaspirillum sp. CPCC 100848]MEC4721668.1 redox-sensitive transcriptional activator SoxR [Noviherbaspirillum sp. CPCC 100848]
MNNHDENAGSAPLPQDLSVGEMARRSGVAVSALHFYEAKGLIRSRRTPGNQRRYTRDMLRRVGVIKAAQRLGIPLSDIEAALKTLPESRTPTARDWERLAKRWKEDLDDRIQRMILLRERLTGCIGCGCLSMKLCPLVNPADSVAECGAGPQFLEPGAAPAPAAPSESAQPDARGRRKAGRAAS